MDAKEIIARRITLEPTPGGVLLKEVAPGVSAQDVIAVTEATLVVPTDVSTMHLAQ